MSSVSGVSGQSLIYCYTSGDSLDRQVLMFREIVTLVWDTKICPETAHRQTQSRVHS